MRQIAVILALKAEAMPLIRKMGLEKDKSKPGLQLYKNGQIILALSGIGLERAAKTTGLIISEFKPKVVINCGTAGSLSCDLSAGDCAEIASVSTENTKDKPLILIGSETAESFAETRLVSSQTPVTDDITRNRLSEFADCVDMEGFAIAETCELNEIECRILKIISDSHGDTDAEKIRHSIDLLSAALCEFTLPVIKEYF